MLAQLANHCVGTKPQATLGGEIMFSWLEEA